VNEAVRTTVFGSNEAIAFFGIEEFHGADGHSLSFHGNCRSDPRGNVPAELGSVKRNESPKARSSVAGDVARLI
jgi:hypothetical protein